MGVSIIVGIVVLVILLVVVRRLNNIIAEMADDISYLEIRIRAIEDNELQNNNR